MNLFESLYIFNKCYSNIEAYFHDFKSKQERKENSKEWDSRSHHQFIMPSLNIILETCSYLEEYNGAFCHITDSKYKQRILELRKICKPIIKLINSKWSDLRAFRSQIVAHGWRKDDKQKTFCIPNVTFYKIPRNFFEFQLLFQLMMYLQSLIMKEFGEETIRALEYVESLKPKITPPPDYSDINNEINKMRDEVNDRAKQYNKPYNLHLVQYYDFDMQE